MRHFYIHVLIASMMFTAACSREARPVLPAPIYSAASIAPSGAEEPPRMSPGRLITIYGQNLGPKEPCNRNAPESPGMLCETEVTVSGAKAILLYVSAAQINLRVPGSATTKMLSTIRVTYKGQAGPDVPIQLTEASSAEPAKKATLMLANLRGVRWRQDYASKSERCAEVPAQQGGRGAINGYAFYCAQTEAGIIAETFYFPYDHAAPKLLLLRAEFRLASPDIETSAEVEKLLGERLTREYGAAIAPSGLYEIGATLPQPGLSWSGPSLKIFVHRNRNHVAPAGVRYGVTLIALRKELLNEREAELKVANTGYRAPDATKVSEQQTRAVLLRLLRRSTGEPEQRAAALIEADVLARRLAYLLVVRTYTKGSESLRSADHLAEVSHELAPYGVSFGDIELYNADRNYDFNLLRRAWHEYPSTQSGQRAFLMLQQLGCATSRFGCQGPNCFSAVIERGRDFLRKVSG